MSWKIESANYIKNSHNGCGSELGKVRAPLSCKPRQQNENKVYMGKNGISQRNTEEDPGNVITPNPASEISSTSMGHQRCLMYFFKHLILPTHKMRSFALLGSVVGLFKVAIKIAALRMISPRRICVSNNTHHRRRNFWQKPVGTRTAAPRRILFQR